MTTTTAPATGFGGLRITEIHITEINRDRTIVRATLADGSTRRLVDVPKGRVYLMAKGLVGRTFQGAHDQILCWMEAQDDGKHRIVEVLAMPCNAGDDAEDRANDDYWGPSLGDWMIVARMSDGSVQRVFRFYQDELRLTDTDLERFLNLSTSQASDLKGELDKERVPDGFNTADYGSLNRCFVCNRTHR